MHASKFCTAAAGVRGISTRAPLAYLLRDQLIPTAEVDDNADDYPDLDHELIACHPIIHKDHLALDVDKLEKRGPKKKVTNVNTDNAALFTHPKTCFKGTSWWTHAKSADTTKDGCAVWFALELNLQTTNVMDQDDIKNKANIQLLRYCGETYR